MSPGYRGTVTLSAQTESQTMSFIEIELIDPGTAPGGGVRVKVPAPRAQAMIDAGTARAVECKVPPLPAPRLGHAWGKARVLPYLTR